MAAAERLPQKGFLRGGRAGDAPGAGDTRVVHPGVEEGEVRGEGGEGVVVVVGREGGGGAVVWGRFGREGGHAEGEVLAETRDVAGVEGFALAGGFLPQRVQGLVRHGVLRGRWRVVGWEVAGRGEGVGGGGGRGPEAGDGVVVGWVRAGGDGAGGGGVADGGVGSGGVGRGGGEGRVEGWGQGEEEDAGVDLPEGPLADEHFLPAFAGAVVDFRAHAGVFACDEAHAFEFGEEVAPFEDAFAFDVDSPVAFGAGGGGEVGGRACVEVGIGRGLMGKMDQFGRMGRVQLSWRCTWWKYQYSVAQSIIAICRDGEDGGLNSLLLGLEIEERKRASFFNVGFRYRCTWPCFCGIS